MKDSKHSFQTKSLSEKLQKIDDRLAQEYGRPRKRRNDPCDVLIATILSQNTNDKNSGKTYAALREAFPNWEQVRVADTCKLESVLRPGGLARIKARRIQKILNQFAEPGEIDLRKLANASPKLVEKELLKFDGVGYKTARCVMLFGLGMEAFPIDTHIERVLKRVGVVPADMPMDRAHQYITAVIPSGRALSLHLNLITHGRQVCHPQKPCCIRCAIERLCRYAARHS